MINKKILALDLETTGLNPYKDKIICIGVYTKDTQLVFRDFSKFQEWFKGAKSKYYFIGQNFKFDLKFLIIHNLITIEDAEEIWEDDTQHMAHVFKHKVPDSYLEWYEEERRKLNKLLPKGISHREAKKNSLKTLAPYFLGVEPFWEDPTNHDSDEYVLKDCKYTYDLYHFFLKNMSQKELAFNSRRMMPWAKMLLKTELRGIKIDIPLVEQLKQEYSTKVENLRNILDIEWADAYKAFEQKQIEELADKYVAMEEKGREKISKLDKEKRTPKRYEANRAKYDKLFEKSLEKIEKKINFDSPKQMLWLLKDYFKFDVTTIEGDESTGSEVLERLASQGHPELKTFLEYKGAQKIINAFLEPFLEQHINGTVHCQFNLTGTRTGRLSSSNFNLQQIPSELYKVFKAREGHTLIQYDQAMIEALLIAYYSDDPELYYLVENDLSIHDTNAIAFFNLDCEPKDVKKKYPEERQIAKTVGFALFYGAGYKRIQQAMQQIGIIKTEEECKKMLKNVQKKFKEAIAFHKEITARLENDEEVTNILGRPIYIEHKKDVYMKGFNSLIQSSASDLVIQSAYKCGYPVLMLVHDFIMIEVPISEAKEAERKLIECMTGYNLTNSLGQIKLKVEGQVNECWTK